MSVGGGTESYHRTSASVEYVALIADANELARVAIDLEGRELRVENELVCLSSSPATAKLVCTLAYARDVARESPDVFESPEAVHALQQSLVQQWIGCLPDRARRGESAVQARRARIMARFEEVVEGNATRPLHLPEVCRLVGVPERTLRKCCQQHLGMGPHHYLLLRRIQLARRALLRGDPSGATVTSIATRHGFWDLGRFAAVYRSMFGEAPSATLRRQQAEFA